MTREAQSKRARLALASVLALLVLGTLAAAEEEPAARASLPPPFPQAPSSGAPALQPDQPAAAPAAITSDRPKGPALRKKPWPLRRKHLLVASKPPRHRALAAAAKRPSAGPEAGHLSPPNDGSPRIPVPYYHYPSGPPAYGYAPDYPYPWPPPGSGVYR